MQNLCLCQTRNQFVVMMIMYFLSTADSIRSNDDLMSLKLGCYSTMLSVLDRAPTPKHIFFRPHSWSFPFPPCAIRSHTTSRTGKIVQQNFKMAIMEIWSKVLCKFGGKIHNNNKLFFSNFRHHHCAQQQQQRVPDRLGN